MTPDITLGQSRLHGYALACALFLLAPLVGEWLFGNQPITSLGSLFFLAPMYGSGALLIREIARRCGRGWATMFLLAAAYALIEEGPIDQMLWNPTYGGFDMANVYAETYIPLLGTSVQMIQDVLSAHVIWSIVVPIALVEAFDPTPHRAWLGRVGLALVALLFVVGSIFLAMGQIQENHFVATRSNFVCVAILIVALLVAAFALSRRRAVVLSGVPPRPRTVGVVTFVLSSLYEVRDVGAEVISGWGVAILWCVLAVLGFGLLARWSRRAHWTEMHVVAAAGGALLTYAWVGFEHGRYLDVPSQTAILGSTVFAACSVLLLAAAVRSVRLRSIGRACHRALAAL